jgi:hypothetical protein
MDYYYLNNGKIFHFVLFFNILFNIHAGINKVLIELLYTHYKLTWNLLDHDSLYIVCLFDG